MSGILMNSLKKKNSIKIYATICVLIIILLPSTYLIGNLQGEAKYVLNVFQINTENKELKTFIHGKYEAASYKCF